eukprot:GHVO01066384.1.p1 GENE.GHVO01066384.1~~GHVO01066384.1.p1  ORF type:complete len:574 (+),score=132.77 GHVO01066384.1:950-2671(+)
MRVKIVAGRQHPVTSYYGPSLALPLSENTGDDENYLDDVVASILQIHFTKPDDGNSRGNDMLVFLPGQAEIERVSITLSSMIAEINKSLPPPRVCVDICRQTGKGEESVLASCTAGNVPRMIIIPMFASLPLEDQQKAFQKTPKGCRKVILATNIAETSLTIPNIKYVVDSGRVKVTEFNANTGIEALRLRLVSKTMSNQRAGRAGRDAPGEVYRIYSMQNYSDLDAHIEPEIVRTDISQTILSLLSLGVTNIDQFPFITTPPVALVRRGMTVLKKIGAIDNTPKLLPLGHRLIALPVAPHIGKMLIESVTLGCTAEALTISAMLCTDAPWGSMWKKSAETPTPSEAAPSTSSQVNNSKHFMSIKKKIQSPDGDHLSLLNAYKMWEKTTDQLAFCRFFSLIHRNFVRAKEIRNQLKSILMKELKLDSISSCGTETEILRKCMAKSFTHNVAKYDVAKKAFFTLGDRQFVKLHPTSVFFDREKPTAVVFSETVMTTSTYIRDVTAIDPLWISHMYPDAVSTSSAGDEIGGQRGDAQLKFGGGGNPVHASSTNSKNILQHIKIPHHFGGKFPRVL